MKKCYLCNSKLSDHNIYNFYIKYCDNCDVYYIDKKYINTFFINYADNIIKYKSTRHKELLYKFLEITNNTYIVDKDLIQCMNQECMQTCYYNKLHYKNLTFYFCNYTNQYCFNISNLKQYIIKNNRISLFYYYKEIIFKGLKKLFVKG